MLHERVLEQCCTRYSATVFFTKGNATVLCYRSGATVLNNGLSNVEGGGEGCALQHNTLSLQFLTVPEQLGQ